MEGGHAIADILFGRAVPGGKLPCVFPKSEAHPPFFDKKEASNEYGLFHGYRLMDKKGFEPALAFGFGLSYTTFRYDRIEVDKEELGLGGRVRIRVNVTNTVVSQWMKLPNCR